MDLFYRRLFFRCVLLGAASLVALLMASGLVAAEGTISVSNGSGAARGVGRPNLLLITADDMHWDSLGCFGCPVEATTPNLDALATQGMRLTNAYVPIALCTPSRHVMLSGNHSHQTATRCFTPIQRLGPTLPDLLKEAGYLIANFNKQQDDYGWDIAIDEDESAIGRDVPFFGESAERVFHAARSQQKPFFLMANINDPHRPFCGSEAEANADMHAKFASAGRITHPSRTYSPAEVTVPGFLPDLPEVRQEMAEYYSSVRRADDIVGELLGRLAASGQAENTIVVFLSDHGISMPYSKMNCYKASLRTPVIVRWPGRVEAGSEDARLVSTVDLAPTLLECVGLAPPGHMAGQSLCSALKGRPCVSRDIVVGYHYRNLRQDILYPTFAVHTERYAYIYNPWVDGAKEVHNSDYTGSPTLEAMWRLAESDREISERVEFHKHRVIEEFYDYASDPFALNNRIDDPTYASEIARLKGRLADWMSHTQHPARGLLEDPHNAQLREAYLQFEVATARQRLAELSARSMRQQATLQEPAVPKRTR